MSTENTKSAKKAGDRWLSTLFWVFSVLSADKDFRESRAENPSSRYMLRSRPA
ncbi:hypothetical protein [Collimonas sp. PA-H2]|uniref:hypothetical protein n=1 Tax=Collimonas sp. PA-H2 TaxID=1881062 RepID=UPI001304419B|nr:hypothetical protein [Collimonas sp. PA-H2]